MVLLVLGWRKIDCSGEMETLFFTFLILSAYPYLIYPAVVFIMSKLFSHPWKMGDSFPPVTLIISVYNEEQVIGEKVKNTLSLEYPEGLLEIIVISDGSNDRTNEIVSTFNDSRLVLKAFPERSGKTACLNRVIPETKGDIILFTDANSMLSSNVLLRLVKIFSDENVGLVTGWTKYAQVGEDKETTDVYSKLEEMTKYWESLISSCVGADGAIFAIRREVYKPLEEQDINDFVIPLDVISQGKRVVLDPEIYCFEESSKGESEEFQRQTRITNRTLRAILKHPRFLNPFSYGFFSFFLLSHKLLRFLVPFFVMGAFLTNLFLLKVSSFYIGLIFIQLLFLSLGLANLVGKADGRVANICKFFLITLLAQFLGWIRRFRGISDTMWTPQR
jgi:cellulose synthase/poly-beta-1,6-N-acetylglucosamine synthase-like glycosyltransferase